MAKNTGARGLRAILESILTEAMYEVCMHYPWILVATHVTMAMHVEDAFNMLMYFQNLTIMMSNVCAFQL